VKTIVAYEATVTSYGVLITRLYNDIQDGVMANSWEEASKFLTQQVENSIHVTWNLNKFATALFTLLPEEKRKELTETPRIHYNNSKIFYIISRLLGITNSYWLRGNTYQILENNFYQLQHWLPAIETPATLQEVAKLGEQILQALEALGIYPSKLTSPVSVYEDTLAQYNLPTLWSNDNDTFIDACNYCIPTMRNEWRQVFGTGLFDKTYTYDIVGAYPYFISELPNTDNCKIEFNDKFIVSDWGIMKGKLKLFKGVTPIQPAQEHLTSEQHIWLYQNGTGHFDIENGYFFYFENKDNEPFKPIISKLFELRQNNGGIASNIAKKIAQGISGKLDQENMNGTLGELYNPILALMVRSRCSLAVASFIYKNDLQDSLVEVNVDSITTTKRLDIKDSNEVGSWRLKL